jgi:trigger factor
MKVTVEDLSSVKKVLHIEVPQEAVVSELDSAYNQLKKTAKVKGFRPGKTPRSVLQRLYGKEVNADVTGKLIQSAFIDALKETELMVVGSPEVDPPELNDQTPYCFDATVEVRPEIADIDFKGLKLTKTKYAVSDNEIDKQLQMLQKNLAKCLKIDEDRPLASGDVAVIDYEGFKDGAPFEATQKTENFTLTIGSGQIIKAFDDGMMGMRADEEKQIEVTFPEDYFKPELKGQQITFTVKLNEIREEILPEIDDAFAKSIGDQFESLGALKTKIRENLEGGYQKRTDQELNEQIFQQLLGKVEFEVPGTLVDGELEHILNDAEQKFTHSNKSLEDLGLTREGLAEQYRPVAEKQVRRHLILSKLIDQEAMTLSDEELEAGFKEMSENYHQPVDHIKGYYNQNKEGLELFKHTLLEKKTLNLIISDSKITETDPPQDNDTGNAAG